MEASCTSRAKIAYGIELAGSEALVVRADRRGCRIMERVRLGEDGLRGVARMAAREKARLAAAIPVRDSFTQWIQAPFSSVSKARKVFDSLLDLQIPFPVEDCMRAYTRTELNADRNVETLAVGAERDSLAQLLDQLQADGIDPEVVDHEGLALWDMAAEELPFDAEVPRLLIHLGVDRMVVVAGRPDRFAFARSSRIVWDGSRLKAGEIDRISRRMLRLVAAETGEENAEIIICGPQAEDFDERKELSDALGLSGRCEYLELENPAAFLASALARRALGRGRRGINLRGGDMRHPAVAAAQVGRERRRALLALAAGILLCAGNIVFARMLLGEERAVQRRLQRRAREVSGMERVPRGMEVKTVREELAKRRAAERRLEGLFKPSEGALALKMTAFAARNGIRFDRIDLRDGKALIAGTASDWDSCRLLADFMEGSGYAAELERQDAGVDERVHFSIEGLKDNA